MMRLDYKGLSTGNAESSKPRLFRPCGLLEEEAGEFCIWLAVLRCGRDPKLGGAARCMAGEGKGRAGCDLYKR